MSRHVGVIVNPKSASGATGRKLPKLELLLRRHVGAHSLWLTEGPGDGARLAAQAAAQGVTHLVVAGGDGTVSEVVTGLLAAGRGDVAVAILPLGSGSDLARFLGLGKGLAAAARLAQGTTRRVDVGRIRCSGPDGQPRERYFLNIASFGMSGPAMLWLQAQGRRGRRGRLSYVESALHGLRHFRAADVRVSADGAPLEIPKLLLGVVANGQYFGNGMRIAPEARLDDGLFDVLFASQLSTPTALGLFARVLLQRPIAHPRVERRKVRVLELASAEEVWIEADGDPVGTLPARFEVLPAALTLWGVPG